MSAAMSGDKVTIHYTGTLEDGTVFDTTQDGDPFTFEAGGDEVIPGLANAVVGMTSGESKRLTLAPAEAYGERRDGLEQQVPRNLVPEEVEEGDAVRADVGEETVVFWVVALDDEHATLDPNHPLAGHALTFDIEMMGVEPPAAG